MKKRKALTTTLKVISFNVDDNYYAIGDSLDKVFWGMFSNYKYAVAYTEVRRDCGTKVGNRFGAPISIPYDNGLVGYQNFSYFNNKDGALEHFKLICKLTPKYLGGEYTDVFFIERK